jgi:tartrate dehydrogenase/decarboxylase/D-malate dehydrogenase
VQRPQVFDVVVGSNLFGDILSDLGPAVCGTIGIAPSGNINPERKSPVAVRAGARLGARHRRQGHRQSDRPDLVGALMLEFLGHAEAARAIVAAIERVLAEPSAPKTRDLGGRATTSDLGRAIADAI